MKLATRWPKTAPLQKEMFARLDGSLISFRPVANGWLAAILVADGPILSPPLSWTRMGDWLREIGADSPVTDFRPLGSYTSVFDVYAVAPDGSSPKVGATPLTPTRSVYFIQCGETGPIKIGVAVDVKRRMAALQTACPFPLRLLATTPGDTDVESELHDRFAGDRLRGEWFLPTTELLDLIGATA